MLLPFLFTQRYQQGEEVLSEFRAFCAVLLTRLLARPRPADGDTSVWAQIVRLRGMPVPALPPQRNGAARAGAAAGAAAAASTGATAIGDAQLAAEIATLIVGGYETTANVLTWWVGLASCGRRRGALHACPATSRPWVQVLGMRILLFMHADSSHHPNHTPPRACLQGRVLHCDPPGSGGSSGEGAA